MRLVPASLFGRMVSVLFLGLLVAQLISVGLLLRDRGETLFHTMGQNVVERVASAVRLLNAIPADLRGEAVTALSSTELRVSLDDGVADPVQGDLGRVGDSLRRQLRAALGPEARFLLRTDRGAMAMPAHMRAMHPAAGGDGGMGPGGMMRAMPVMARLVDVQVQLGDTAWVRFERVLPESLFDWPQRLLLLLGILLASVVVVSAVAVRWVTRPLQVLAVAAEGLGRDIQRPRLPEGGPREVANAARAFNTMQARLRRFIEDRSRILAAVSHDLKTPITRLRLRSEMLKDEAVADDVRRDLDDMEAMVMATLDFMRGTHSEESSRPVDVDSVIEALVEDLPDAQGRVAVSGHCHRPFVGKPLALRRCLGNLIENAIRYGECARISVEDTPDTLRIRVIDEGPGIPEVELERVFDPFYRLEGSRSEETGGTGLGLGIARNLARAHGGDLVLRNRQSVSGLEAILTLPR